MAGPKTTLDELLQGDTQTEFITDADGDDVPKGTLIVATRDPLLVAALEMLHSHMKLQRAVKEAKGSK